MKILRIFTIIAAAAMLAGCGSGSGDDGSPKLAGQLAGEWHLASWNGETPAEFDAYISFTANGSFEIWQRVERVGYQHFTGSYLLKGNTMTGQYSDLTPWGSAYEISFDASANTLTMVSDSAVGETSVYFRTPIPQSVRNDKWANISRSVGRRIL